MNSRINKEVKQPTRPAGIVGMYVCNLTGQAIPDGGCESHYEYFKKEFLPQKQGAIKQNVLINKDTGRIVVENEVAPNAEWQEHTIVKDITGVNICLDCSIVPTTDANGVSTNQKTATIIN